MPSNLQSLPDRAAIFWGFHPALSVANESLRKEGNKKGESSPRFAYKIIFLFFRAN